MTLRHVRYVGWREDLKGKTALAKDNGFSRHPKQVGQRRVLIQLDDLGPCDEQGVPNGVNSLCYGWHDFAADQWEDIPE